MLAYKKAGETQMFITKSDQMNFVDCLFILKETSVMF